MGLFEEFSWRQLVHQTTDERLAALLNKESFTLYAGFDPTADSLHVGHLLPMTALRRAQLFGHRPIAVVGGATGMIGDPSGKSEERSFLSPEQLEKNVAGIRAQLGRCLDFSGDKALLVNNYDWTKDFSLLQFLRDIGKQFSIGMMLGKDSVRTRLEKESGISYTEFSYMLLQAYDFLHLRRAHDCRLQIGGSDQWGNITAGIELIRRLDQNEAFGLTLPLVMNSGGQKFGKTEKGTVWLSPERTSSYEFYQFFVQTDDRDVGKFLRYFTFLDEPTLLAIEAEMASDPAKRSAQRKLAHEVTALVHGASEADKAATAALALFQRGSGGEVVAPPGAPEISVTSAILDGGIALAELLVQANLCASKGAARRDIEGGGVYINEERVTDVARVVNANDRKQGFVLLRKGKKSYCVVRVT